MRWVAMYSRTGSELVQVSMILRRYPDLVLTDTHSCMENLQFLQKFSGRLIHSSNVSDLFKVLESVLRSAQYVKDEGLIVTLHGFLHIIPPQLCELADGCIFNGHPGLITEYPELKGLNPQKRAWESRYPRIGAVLHQVTAEVDSGRIVMEKALDNYNYTTLDAVFGDLHDISVTMWSSFLERVFIHDCIRLS